MRPGDTVSEPESSRPGSVLRAEREALGVTVREVSETLNLSMTVIEAIEADEYQRLPGPVFARGYVRAYARLLELDPEPLVAQFPGVPDPLPSGRRSPEPPIWEWIRRRPALVLGGAAALALLLLMVLLVSVWPEKGAEPAQDAAADADPYRSATAATGFQDGSPTAPATMPRQAPDAFAAPDASDTGDSGTAPFETRGATSAPADSSAVPPLQTPAVQAGGGSHRITDSGDDRLAFAFTDDCWVEVRDGAGARLYGDLGRGNTRLELVGQGPFRILLGYAPGAQLRFNDEPVPLAPHTRDNVATIVLGQ